MEILRTIIRFLVIIIAIAILVFLSITLFKLIPRGINQLASATVSLGKTETIATTTPTQPVAQPAPVTDNGLNGIYTTQGDIVILENAPAKAPVKTVAKPVVKTPTYTYYNPTPVLSGRKNLRVSYSTMGVILNGQFVARNTFTTEDTISVRFLVLNEQDSPTGSYSMRVEMPAREYDDKVKVLNNLNSIPGGSSYSVEARFSGVDLSQGTPIVRIYLDTENQVAESNESDNTVAVEIKNISNTYYNNTNYNYNYNNCDYSGNYSYNYNCNNNYSTGYNNNNSYSPNLSIVSLEVGRVINGSFYSQSYVNYGEKLAVRARVRNNGGYFSNSWSSKISLVDSNGYTRDFIPGSDNGLASGSESTILYEIDSLTRGTNRITFMADTSNAVSESNEGDNTQYATVQVN